MRARQRVALQDHDRAGRLPQLRLDGLGRACEPRARRPPVGPMGPARRLGGHNREGFAFGAVVAAEWIIGKKGIFSMKDVLDLHK